MSLADIYNRRAFTARAAAAAEPLPLRREQHERSARHWEKLAQDAEETERLTELNLAEKREKVPVTKQS